MLPLSTVPDSLTVVVLQVIAASMSEHVAPSLLHSLTVITVLVAASTMQFTPTTVASCGAFHINQSVIELVGSMFIHF